MGSIARVCADEQSAVDKAKSKKPNWVAHPVQAYNYERDVVNPLQARLKRCKEHNSEQQGIGYSLGMARVAADVGFDFPLRKGWASGAGGYDQVVSRVKRGLKVSKPEDAVAKIEAQARKEGVGTLLGAAMAYEFALTAQAMRQGKKEFDDLIESLSVGIASFIAGPLGSGVVNAMYLVPNFFEKKSLEEYTARLEGAKADYEFQLGKVKKARSAAAEEKAKKAEAERKKKEAEAARKAAQAGEKKTVSDTKEVPVKWYEDGKVYAAAGAVGAVFLLGYLFTPAQRS